MVLEMLTTLCVLSLRSLLLPGYQLHPEESLGSKCIKRSRIGTADSSHHGSLGRCY